MYHRNLKMLAIAATLAAATIAQAESFNERGEDFIAAAPAGSYAGSPAPAIELTAFNERGEDFIAAAPVGSAQPRAAVVAELGGYNERGGDYHFQASNQTTDLDSLPRLAQTECVAVCSIE